MSNFLIYDVAAESGGALTVLNEFYHNAAEDIHNHYYFVISTPELDKCKNIEIFRLSWVKKSWLHRLYMDNVYIKHLMKIANIDHIISLQNHAISHCHTRQSVYVHNALPYSKFSFSFFSQPYLWFYQNIIGFYTKKTLKYANRIIVQTEWMKKAVSLSAKVPLQKIAVKPVVLNLTCDNRRIETSTKLFFYPATPYVFKNHQIIIDACKRLKEVIGFDYEVVFTLNGTENKYSENIKNQIKKNHLPIKLIGQIDKEQMRNYYQRSCLLFPSYLETVGLPLKEAQYFCAPIIAADCEYAREAAEHYQHIIFFEYTDEKKLASLMETYIKN